MRRCDEIHRYRRIILVSNRPQRNEASFVPRKSFGAVQIRVANKGQPLWPSRRVAIRRGRQDKEALLFPVLEPKLGRGQKPHQFRHLQIATQHRMLKKRLIKSIKVSVL
jgi:hypothetical protein